MIEQVEEITVEDAFHRAVRYHNNGEFGYAVELYTQILEASPNHSDAMHLLGILGSQFGQHEEAINLINQAIEILPDQPIYRINLGNVLQAQGKFEEAEQSYQQAIDINPAMAEAHYNLGYVFEQQDRVDDAVCSYHIAIETNPQYAEAHINLGNVLQAQGKFEEAEQSYQQAIDINPAMAEAHYNLGCVFEQQDRINDAAQAYQSAIDHKSDYIEALNNLGNVHKTLGDFEEATRVYEQVLGINPDVNETLYNLGVVKQKLNQRDDAMVYYRRVVQAGAPFIDAHRNLGYLLRERQELDESVQIYRRALEIEPDNPEVHIELAFVLLSQGDFRKGLEEYEWRWKSENLSSFKREFIQPFWDGSPLDGKTILLHAEQGFGDTIQFVRYADLITNSNTKIIVECQPELVTLLEGMDSINQVIPTGELLPDFDVYAPILSLPYILKTDADSIPNQVPYLFSSVPDEAVSLNAENEFKVGLVWAGNQENEVENSSVSRSIELLDFAPLFDLNACQFYSLQVGSARTDIIIYDFEDEIVDLGSSFNDFSETAAAIMQLDLVISVDTAVAHLAGALGKSVWTLLPTVAEWRWMLDRSDTLWYPTMKLFRQEDIEGNWETVIQKVKTELMQLIGNRAQPLSKTRTYNLKEAAQLIGISANTYRNWERRELISSVLRDPKNNRRCFTEGDITRLKEFVDQRKRDR